jgi:hypothetical protein
MSKVNSIHKIQLSKLTNTSKKQVGNYVVIIQS